MNAMLTSRRLAGIAILALAIPLLACGQNPAAPATESAAEVSAAWSNAFNSGSPAALAALYADNARSLPPEGGVLAGRQQIESYWRGDIGEGGATTKLTTADAAVQGDLLQVEGTYEVSGANDFALAKGQFQQLWTRGNNGWQLQREMWRLDPALFRSMEVAERLTAEWTAAYNAGNAKALAGLYSAEAILSTGPSGSFSGPVAIESFWVRDFGDAKPSSELTLTDAYMSGELAHLEGEYKVADQGTTTEGRYVQLWMREGNAWRIHREMWLR
jgi:ketosteroid isomerase-like protein